jgi:electron transfer flavoprotein alpha subunit
VNRPDESVPGAAVPEAAPILVVLAPVADGDAVAAGARRALVAEAGRLAVALGVQTRHVAWPAGPEVDFDSLAAALAELARDARPAAILVQDGAAGRRLAPALAHRLGTGAVLGCSDARVCELHGEEGGPGGTSLVFVKPVYGGWLEQEVVAAEDFVPIVTLDLEGMEVMDGPEGVDTAESSVEPEMLAFTPPALPRIRHVETVPPDPRSVDLIHSRRIVAAGMGTARDDLLAAVQELAGLLEGSVGATRPVVDEGLLPKERLIGQTGRTVTPDLYIALGISGSPHHVAGVRGAERVVSVNRDVRAPIFQFSDVGFVADLEAVLPTLVEKIKAWRDAPAGGDHA